MEEKQQTQIPKEELLQKVTVVLSMFFFLFPQTQFFVRRSWVWNPFFFFNTDKPSLFYFENPIEISQKPRKSKQDAKKNWHYTYTFKHQNHCFNNKEYFHVNLKRKCEEHKKPKKMAPHKDKIKIYNPTNFFEKHFFFTLNRKKKDAALSFFLISCLLFFYISPLFSAAMQTNWHENVVFSSQRTLSQLGCGSALFFVPNKKHWRTCFSQRHAFSF